VLKRIVLIGVVVFAAAPLCAQDTTARKLPAVQVTRDRARSSLELPYAISAVRPDSVSPGQTHTQPEQTLFLLPGVTVANRNNPSQDARISIRGFGARSQFGVRSLRVMRDGMPLTLADGQTPLDYLDLEAVGRVETLRGSASALYGNASGGVIDLRSAPPPSVPLSVQARSWAGSNGLQRNTVLLGGSAGGAWYSVNGGHTKSDGTRDYANQELTNMFARAGTSIFGTDISIIGLGLDMPMAQNPGALTRVQFDTNATIADPLSVTRKARKAVHQMQAGVQAHRALGDGDLQAMVFGGTRSLYNPLIPNVVEVGRQTSGASARATLPFASRHRVTAGVDAQRMSDARKNWAPCNGVATVTANCPTVGVERGVMTLDQREIVTSMGTYARDEISMGRTLITAGVRADRTTYDVADHFTTDGRDDSGNRNMSAVSPMIGVTIRARPDQVVYANISTAFETPTTTEMVNKPDSSAGLSATLKPQYSTTMEIGSKGSPFGWFEYDVALFSTRVRDELIGFDIGGGRLAYRNVGSTRRRGGEAAIAAEAGPLTLNLTLTYSQFVFVDFLSGTTQLRGKTIPGIPEMQSQFSALYRNKYGFALVETITKDRVFVNDANLASAPSYGLINLRFGSRASLGKPWLSPVFGIQNLLDEKYVASVAVNAAGTVASGKFYEPGPGRTWFVGLTAATTPW